MMKYSVALTEEIQKNLAAHLIRADRQEDLCFALYNPSTGATRFSGVICEVILPLEGERQIHGNVSFNPSYLDRVSSIALEKKCGICFLHSHPSKGWQGMSPDDIAAEKMLAPRIKATTGLPLLGMTVGSDETWSGRFWIKTAPKTYTRHWCESVRVVGKGFIIHYNDKLVPAPENSGEFVRTVSAWGEQKQATLSRLHVGIVGLGSVGSIVAEALLKTGIRHITLIDFDTVELKNLDRLQGIGKNAVGKLKIDVVKMQLVKQRLFKKLSVQAFPYSIVEATGLHNALDCDIIFSCVDRPWPRYTLNCISYANGIPVIDGGIEAGINKHKSNLDQARWKAHAVSPGRICLNCLGQYKSEDVGLELSGLLDDPSYIKGLPKEHFINRGENVFVFSTSLAAMEMQQFLSLILQPRGQYYGPKEFDFNSGNIDSDFPFACNPNCGFPGHVAEGDKLNNTLIASHPLAEQKRKEAVSRNRFVQGIKHFFSLI